MILVMVGGRIRASASWIAELVVLAAVCGWLAPNAWIGRAAAGFVYARAIDVPARTFAIVPGSRVHHGRPLAILKDRLETALDLYRSGRVKAVLVSGADTAEAPEAAVMQAWFAERGVPSGDVWTDGGGTRTRQTMVRAVSQYGVADAIICTQAVNAARSVYLARQVGIDAVAVALPSHLESNRRYRAIESLKTTLAFAESLGSAPARPDTMLAAR